MKVNISIKCEVGHEYYRYLFRLVDIWDSIEFIIVSELSQYDYTYNGSNYYLCLDRIVMELYM